MIPEHYKSLVEKLIARTINKTALWEKTSRDNEFRLQLTNSLITIDKWYDNQIPSMLIDMAIYNEEGQQIDKIVLDLSDEGYEQLEVLHNAIKRSYYKVDETFKSILDELDSGKQIGRNSFPTHDDSDIPF